MNSKVSPIIGNPMDPGGSLPLHFGFLQRYIEWQSFNTMSETTKVNSPYNSNIFVSSIEKGVRVVRFVYELPLIYTRVCGSRV